MKQFIPAQGFSKVYTLKIWLSVNHVGSKKKLFSMLFLNVHGLKYSRVNLEACSLMEVDYRKNTSVLCCVAVGLLGRREMPGNMERGAGQ
jgi:hypothetical protein